MRRWPDAPLEVYGETAPSVQRVVVRYRLPSGASGKSRATLLRARDKSRLREAGVRAPFGYFIGQVPPGAKHVSAVALGPGSKELGRIPFDRLARGMHPTVFISEPE